MDKQNQGVVNQIGRLVTQVFQIVVFRGQNDFGRLLADFLADVVRCPGKELGRVGPFRQLCLPPPDKFFQTRQHSPFRALTLERHFRDPPILQVIVEAAVIPLVTGGPGLVNRYQQSIPVAVSSNVNDLLPMAGRFSFLPETPPASAEKPGASGRQGFVE